MKRIIKVCLPGSRESILLSGRENGLTKRYSADFSVDLFTGGRESSAGRKENGAKNVLCKEVPDEIFRYLRPPLAKLQS